LLALPCTTAVCLLLVFGKKRFVLMFHCFCIQIVKWRVLYYTGNQLDPRHIVCDFELSIKVAVEHELPNAEVQLLVIFIFCSLWRKMQMLGLALAYCQHNSVREAFRKITALAFLPVLLVRQNLSVFLASRT